MRKLLTTVVLALSAAGCRQLSDSLSPAVPIDAAAIAPTIEVVCARHDAYVDADPALAEFEKEARKIDSALLLQILHAALGRTPPN